MPDAGHGLGHVDQAERFLCTLQGGGSLRVGFFRLSTEALTLDLAVANHLPALRASAPRLCHTQLNQIIEPKRAAPRKESLASRQSRAYTLR